MNIIQKIKERWNAIKAIITSDEYYVAISIEKKRQNFSPIIYEYFTNSDRKIFFKFVNDDSNERIENSI